MFTLDGLRYIIQADVMVLLYNIELFVPLRKVSIWKEQLRK